MRTQKQLADQFQQYGAIVINQDEVPLLPEQWHTLALLLKRMDYAKVVSGDTGDPHSVWVGRFVNDIEKPQPLHTLSHQVLGILMNNRMHRFFADILGAYPLCVRRCQANRLLSGDFIGYHIDQDTTPDYKATAVIQFSDSYQGGEFVLHHPESGDKVMELPKYSILINRGDIPHQVKPVEHGERLTLACFFSTNFGLTQKPRSEIKIVPPGYSSQ